MWLSGLFSFSEIYQCQFFANFNLNRTQNRFSALKCPRLRQKMSLSSFQSRTFKLQHSDCLHWLIQLARHANDVSPEPTDTVSSILDTVEFVF